MLDRRRAADELGDQQKAADECWRAICLPLEVLPFSWAGFLDELLAGDWERRANSLRRDRNS